MKISKTQKLPQKYPKKTKLKKLKTSWKEASNKKSSENKFQL